MVLTKVPCEICSLADLRIIHRHHIIPRVDSRCHNGINNLACLCPNCHSLVHAGEIVILGVYLSTSGRCLVWFKKDEDPPFQQQFWIVKENPLVVTITGDSDDLVDENCQ